MKKLVKLCAVLLAATVVSAFSGCAARTSISANDFQKQAKSAGYTVATASDTSSGASKVLSAKKDGTDVEICYYLFNTADAALTWYTTEKDGLSGSGKTIVDSDAYNKYTLTNGEIYYLVVRMDNTGILCKTTLAKKDEADQFVKALKY